MENLLKINEKYTIMKPSLFGVPIIWNIIVKEVKGNRVIFTLNKKRKLHSTKIETNIIIWNGWIDIPEVKIYASIQHSEDYTEKVGYGSYSTEPLAKCWLVEPDKIIYKCIQEG